MICMSKVEAVREKDAGNAAYASGDYQKAVDHFSRCIELEPRCKFAVCKRVSPVLVVFKWMTRLGSPFFPAQTNYINQ